MKPFLLALCIIVGGCCATATSRDYYNPDQPWWNDSHHPDWHALVINPIDPSFDWRDPRHNPYHPKFPKREPIYDPIPSLIPRDKP